jgi:hypothetical protein
VRWHSALYFDKTIDRSIVHSNETNFSSPLYPQSLLKLSLLSIYLSVFSLFIRPFVHSAIRLYHEFNINSRDVNSTGLSMRLSEITRPRSFSIFQRPASLSCPAIYLHYLFSLGFFSDADKTFRFTTLSPL